MEQNEHSRRTHLRFWVSLWTAMERLDWPRRHAQNRPLLPSHHSSAHVIPACPKCPALCFHSPADILSLIQAQFNLHPVSSWSFSCWPWSRGSFPNFIFLLHPLDLESLVPGCVAGSQRHAHSSTCKYFLRSVLGTVLDQTFCLLQAIHTALCNISPRTKQFQPGDQGVNTDRSRARVRAPDTRKDLSKPYACLAPALPIVKQWKALSHFQLFATQWTNPWNSPVQNTGVGSHSLLQGIFPAWGSNPGLLHCGRVLYQLSHQGSPPCPQGNMKFMPLIFSFWSPRGT